MTTGRRIAALLAALVYGTGVGGAPLAHWRTEVLRAASGVEQGHSERCSVLHVESACAATAGPAHGVGPAREVRFAAPDPQAAAPDVPTSHPPYVAFRRTPSVRAPPLR